MQQGRQGFHRMRSEQLGDQLAIMTQNWVHGQHAADDARALGGGLGTSQHNG